MFVPLRWESIVVRPHRPRITNVNRAMRRIASLSALFGCLFALCLCTTDSARAQIVISGPPSSGAGPKCYESSNGGIYSENDAAQLIDDVERAGGTYYALTGGDYTLRYKDGHQVYLHQVKCPWSSAFRGAWIAFFTAKITAKQKAAEANGATDQITNAFIDIKDPLGAGVSGGYGFAPLHDSVLVSPFLSLEYPNTSVSHTFANGSFLGTTSNFSGTLGVKIGPAITPEVWLYGLGGVSWLNETLRVNFIPIASSTSRNVVGGTLGVGAAFAPDFLQGLGRPISVFVEYHHTWWQDASFNAPAASPGFNYNFGREDDVVKAGFSVSLWEPTASLPARPAIPVKARPLK